MNRKTLLVTLLSGTLVAAAALAAINYTPAKAAAPAAGAATIDIHGRGFGYTDEDLAAALGISVDELATARQEAADAAIDQALSEGLLTQDQADQLREDGTAFPFGRRWGRQLNQAGIDFDALLAEALGISTEELQTARQQAAETAIDRAVSEGNLTEEQASLLKAQIALSADENFRANLQNAYTDAVNQAVSDGVISQEQADQILENATGAGASGFWGMKGPFGRRGQGRHGGWGGDAPFGSGQPTRESTPSSEG